VSGVTVNTLGYDVIEAEVHRKALENLTKDMAITLVRTSGSPVVYEAKDFSTCLFDTVPEHLGFSGYVLFHIGSSLIGTQTIKALGHEDLRPGDGYLLNDPRNGGAMHQGDVGVIMPMFHGGEQLGWGFANMHVLDVGGVGVSGYAPGARDVYQEGIRFPPIRIIRGGAIDPAWEDFIADNVRAPGPVLNDIRSMIAANNVGNQKLRGIVDQFGLERYRSLCDVNKNLSEELFRARIERIPDGVYETIDWTEFDGHEGPDMLLEMRLRLTVDGSSLHFDFTGVPQIDAFVNSAQGAMYGQVMTAIMVMLVYGDFPVNAGLWRPVSIELGEPGTIVNSTDPVPCSNAHSEVGMRACKMTKEVLSQALSLSDDPVLRSRVAGQTQDGFPAVNLFGPNQHGGQSVVFYVDNAVGQGGGAQTVGDGQDSYGCSCMTGCGMADVETHEAMDPVLWLWRRILPNSGGPGQFRGGQAIEQGFTVLYTDRMAGPGFNACSEVPPRGFGGGYSAGSGTYYPIERTNLADLLAEGRLPLKDALTGDQKTVRSKVSHMVVNRTDVQVWQSGGGGGVGDPLLRDPALVAEDVRNAYITETHAGNAYGVVLDGDGNADVESTARRRVELRADRIGGTPARELRGPVTPGASVRIANGGAWACGHCGAELSPTTENWRTAGAVARERPIQDAYAELEMYVRPRSEPPTVVLREYFCPECAGVLAVDVAHDQLEPLAAPDLGAVLAEIAPPG
jgi:N-methylhydantoinase B